MELQGLLQEHKGVIADTWYNATLQMYPPEAARFLRNGKNPFANPVGASLLKAVGAVVDGLAEQKTVEEIAPSLDEALKIRAIQGMPASTAVGFVFALKTAVRAQVGRIAYREHLLAFDAKVDELAMAAFDMYMGHRERLYEIRVGEIRNQAYNMLARAGLISEGPSAGGCDCGEDDEECGGSCAACGTR